jgi:hypothetical protein
MKEEEAKTRLCPILSSATLITQAMLKMDLDKTHRMKCMGS